jgi:hypothetical protein
VVRGIRLDPFFSISPDGGRLIVRDQGAGRIGLFDAATGRELAGLLDELNPWVSTSTNFLSGNRVAVSAAHGRQIRIVLSDGQVERVFPLRVPAAQLLGQAMPARLSLALQEPNVVGLLDLETGRLEEVSGLHPVPRTFWRNQLDPPQPGAEFGKLFSTPDGSLVELDPVTLHSRVLLGKSARD